jgi:hypothetical protein
MAWGLEARVPFLDKAFLEVAMNVDPKEKLFGKGANQTVDDDGYPRMEKVIPMSVINMPILTRLPYYSTSYERLSTLLRMAR